MSVEVHVVSDVQPGDPAGAELLGCVATAFPGAIVTVTRVAPGDTLAAGSLVAECAAAGAGSDRLVAHHLAAARGEPGTWPAGAGERLCMGRTANGTLVVGANRGWTWSFVVGDLRGLCCIDVPMARSEWPARLVTALVHAHRRHPHAIQGVVPRAAVPPPPARLPLMLRTPLAARRL
jgi:hypothetical protein